MCGGGGGGGGDGGAREREEARQAAIRAGMGRIDDTFKQFDDDFFNKRTTAYVDYAMPQLDEQKAKALEALTYALARGPGVNSSVGAAKMADLEKQFIRQKQAIEGQGLQYANDARGDVERNRADLVSQLTASADPTAAANAANARAAMLQAMPNFTPLGQLFTDIAGTVGHYMEGARAKEIVDGVKLYGVGNNGSYRIVR